MDSSKWPVKPMTWSSQIDPSWGRDHLWGKSRNGYSPDNNIKPTYEKVKPYVRNFKYGIDIGCQSGEFAHYMQYDFEHVFSFDYRFFGYNISRNLIDSKNTVWEMGLSDKLEVVEASGKNSIEVDPNNPHHRQDIRRTVTLYPLDAFNFTDIGLIKIDVDGYEAKVIGGAKETLHRCSPAIIIEKEKWDDGLAIDMLLELGYKIVDDLYNHDFVLVKDK